jgi:RNA polymerase sigma-70 factor, ECF subfamily
LFLGMDDLTHLLLDARDGDRDAFAGAVRLAEIAVRRFVGALVDGEEVDDVVQDTFVRAWRALPRYRVEASGLTWVLAIARRASADAIRGRMRRRRIIDAFASVQPSGRSPDPAGASALVDLVRRLEPDRLEAFVLTQVVGLPYAEAAAVSGVPVGTIRSRVARARADLLAADADEAVG